MSAATRLVSLAFASLWDRAEEGAWLASDRRRARNVSPEARTVPAAIGHGLTFLRRRQRADGQMRGFMLLPGASTDWITAHLAFVLEEVEEAKDICVAAATYLAGALERQGACGYNSRVGFDCDSTAQALIAVHRFGLPLPASALEWLLAAQSPQGGFPTYPTGPDGVPSDGWHTPHADVTAIVLLALRRLNAPPAQIERAEAWLAEQSSRGLLTAYWWEGPGYALWAQARSGFEARSAARAAGRLLGGASGLPILAMLAIAASEGERRSFERAARRLLHEQRSDGSWVCAPCLRVTDRRCNLANPFNPGKRHSDRRRLFSTAYAVAALARLAAEPGAITDTEAGGVMAATTGPPRMHEASVR